MFDARAVAEVRPGQITHVRLTLEASGTIKARIVDENGKPIAKARLAPGHSTYVNWDWLVRRPAGFIQSGEDAFALSDEDGAVLFSHLPPGQHRVVCDGKGLERKTFDVFVPPGGIYDLGIVELAPASGCIVIIVDHEEVGDPEYEVMLLRPLGGVVRLPERFRGKEFEISGLDLLTYTVSIRYLGKDYGATSQQAELSANVPKRTVRFEMKRMDTAGE